MAQESTSNQRVKISTNKIVQKQISRKVSSLKKRSKTNPPSHTQHSSTITTNPQRFFTLHKHKQPICPANQRRKTKKNPEFLQRPIVPQNFHHPLFQSSPKEQSANSKNKSPTTNSPINSSSKASAKYLSNRFN